MRVGAEPGPERGTDHRSSLYVYDTRTGAIVGAHHFVGTERELGEESIAELVAEAERTSGIPSEHLAVLSASGLPDIEGATRVAGDGSGLVRVERDELRIRP